MAIPTVLTLASIEFLLAFHPGQLSSVWHISQKAWWPQKNWQFIEKAERRKSFIEIGKNIKIPTCKSQYKTSRSLVEPNQETQIDFAWHKKKRKKNSIMYW